MANKTTNFGLTKPLPTEFYDINVHNGNMDIIDAELKKRPTLGEDGKVLPEQLPEIDSASLATYTAMIGTVWEEDEETGAKYQIVSVPEMTADSTAKVDTVNTHTRNTEGYALYVEEQNQFLEFITNGDAETVNGGIKFYIYGEPNTVEIPIVIEVS